MLTCRLKTANRTLGRAGLCVPKLAQSAGFADSVKPTVWIFPLTKEEREREREFGTILKPKSFFHSKSRDVKVSALKGPSIDGVPCGLGKPVSVTTEHEMSCFLRN